MFSKGDERWPAIAIAFAAVILIVPLWCVGTPGMPDYPAHLASYYLIETGARDAAVSSFYQIHWAPLPNLAGEIAIPNLARLVGLEIAAKLFISLAVALWIFGPALVSRALLGRFSFPPLLSAFFAYNENFMWGFLNYYFAAGLAFVLFAAWIFIRDRKSSFGLALFGLAVVALYFSHLFAVAVLLLLILGLETTDWFFCDSASVVRGVSRIATTMAVFLPTALIFILTRNSGPSGKIEFNLLSTALDRVEAAIQDGYDRPFFALLSLLLIGLAAALWRGAAVIQRRMTGPLVLLAIATLCAPEWAMGGWGVHLRLPAVLGAILFASVEWRWRPAIASTFAASALVLMAYNACALTASWRLYDTQYREFRQVARQLPAGSRLMTVLDGDAIGYQSDQPYWHMAEFAILEPGVFTPLLFTTKDQHIVQLKPTVQAIAARSAEQGSPPDISELEDLAAGQVDGDEDIKTVFPYLMRFQCNYDIAVVIDLDGPRSDIPPQLRLRYGGSFFSLYDITRSPDCARR